MNKIIIQRFCDKCDHGVLPYMDRMGYEECDCYMGVVFTEYELTEAQLAAIERIIKIVLEETK